MKNKTIQTTYWTEIAGVVIAVLLSTLLLIAAFMFAWNGVMPHLLHLPTLDFWQSASALVLMNVLLSPYYATRQTDSKK